ncbi:MAG TPA: exonuclease domain-containing protein, partial [Rhodothermales bacterium]
MRIEDASFVVTDTETTGMRAGEDRLIEIAAVRVSGGFVKERFQQLINPTCPIPGYITRLTGISTGMVADQPEAQEVLPRFLSFLDGGVFVAHNLGFDLRFINAGLRDCEQPELSSHTLCTLRLARRLLPGLRSKSLASVCEFFRIRNRSAHRALADAEATAEVLIRFLEILEREHRIDSLEELVAFQRRPYRSATRSKHLVEIRRRVLPKLPTEPGVYFMKDAAGTVIYIGKARDLKARVSSYFTAIEGHPPRLRKMVDVVRDVTWQITETELDALILESRLIKETQPRFNRAQRQYHVRPFLRLDTAHPFPYVSVVPVLRN